VCSITCGFDPNDRSVVTIATIGAFAILNGVTKAFDYGFIRGSMKNDIFVARLARSAAATAMVSAAVIPLHQTTAAGIPPATAQELAFANRTILPEAESQASIVGSFVVTVPQSPSVWDKQLEREFRELALAEANNTISKGDASRLEQLSRWRDQLLCPQTVDETLLQMKRDRLLIRMENLLQEYVEFQEAASQTGSAS
jgi:hypothetical protein